MSDTQTQALALRTPMDVAETEAKEQASRFLSAGLFKGEPLAIVQQLCRFSLAYGLDPFLNEIIVFQNRPYVTIDGRVRVAQEHPAFNGMECFPASDSERRDMRVQDDEHCWKAIVWRRDRDIPFTAFGRASGAKDKNPVSQQWGQEMASKRARHRALRDAFAMKIPGAEEQPTWSAQVEQQQYLRQGGAVIEGESRVVEPSGRVVAQGTGEIVTEAPIPIRPDQITAIKTMQKAAGIDDDEYREVLRKHFGVDSCTELAEGAASSAIEWLHASAPELEPPATPEQVATLRAASKRKKLSQEQLAAHMMATFGVASGLTCSQAERLFDDIMRDRVGAVVEAPPRPEPPPPDEDELPERDEPPELATEEDLARYGQACALADRLGLDLAGWDADGNTPRAVVLEMEAKLSQRCNEAAGKAGKLL